MKPVRSLYLALLVLVTVATSPLQAQVSARESIDLAALDSHIEEARRAWKIPGLAIAIVKGDSVILARGYGERVLGSGEPVDEHTLFAIASTSKAFTAATLGILVDEGKLHWDDPVRKYLPGFELSDPYVTREVTIRDLLTHRVGVARADAAWSLTDFDRSRLLEQVRYLGQVNGFRAGYGYNNLMYTVAGEVAGAVAGMSWDDLVESRIFRPLGMERTTSRFDQAHARGNIAGAHVRTGDEVISMPQRNFDKIGSAGSLYSSAWEMAQWVRLQLNRGEYRGERLLSEGVIAEMHRPQVVMPRDSIRERLIPSQSFTTYALGWRVNDYNGRKLVEHTGSLNHMKTQVALLPEEDLGIVVVVNLRESTLQVALSYHIIDLVLGIPPTDWSGEYLAIEERTMERSARNTARAKAARKDGTEPSLPLSSYKGRYSNRLFGKVNIVEEEGRLVMRFSDESVVDLEHWQHDTFRGHWRSPLRGTRYITFGLTPQGRVKTLELSGIGVFRR